MTAIYFDSPMNDDARRQRLYQGDIFVFSPRPSTAALCDFAREMLEEAFAPLDPQQAQFHMPVERFVEIFAPLKPKFIHHPKTKQLFKQVIDEMGCDPIKTYIDVPRLRAVTHGGYLTSGVGYAHHPHRDTWYATPMCQLNWWLPIYEFESENSMAFHPHYWTKAIRNGSSRFNYYQWNAQSRKNAAQHVHSDTRVQPKAEEPLELQPELRLVCKPGGFILFPAAHLHSAVANTAGRTRFSMDIRTVHHDEVVSHGGAPNLDSHSPTTSLRDFVRASDLAPFSDKIVASYEKEAPADGVLVFKPESVSKHS